MQIVKNANNNSPIDIPRGNSLPSYHTAVTQQPSMPIVGQMSAGGMIPTVTTEDASQAQQFPQGTPMSLLQYEVNLAYPPGMAQGSVIRVPVSNDYSIDLAVPAVIMPGTQFKLVVRRIVPT